jgi:hypothetical protein
MKVRFTKGQVHYNEVLIVNRGDFEMARITVNPMSRLYTATAFDWTKGAPYFVQTVAEEESLETCRQAVKAFLEPIAEPPAY